MLKLPGQVGVFSVAAETDLQTLVRRSRGRCEVQEGSSDGECDKVSNHHSKVPNTSKKYI